MYFITFCKTMEQVQSTSKKKEKIRIFANFLKKLSSEELQYVCYYSAGRPFSINSELKIQFGWSSLMSVINSLTNKSKSDLQAKYKEFADLGSLVEFALTTKKKTTKKLDSYFSSKQNQKKKLLSINKLNSFFIEIASFTGKGSIKEKKNKLYTLLQDVSPIEGKYIARIITSDTRTGFREGLLVDTISFAFDRDGKDVRYAYMILSDIGEVAKLAKEETDLLSIKPILFNPLKSMLATKTESAEDALETYKELITEYKMDGFRAQLHISTEHCKIYSRNLEDVTLAFPEIINSLSSETRKSLAPCILDGEIVALVGGKPVFFQDLLTRILRKKEVEDSSSRLPTYYYVFDILLLKDESLINVPLIERKERISNISHLIETAHTRIMPYKSLRSKDDIQELKEKAIDDGSEGLMLKDPQSIYLAGKRGKGWLKLKVTLPTLDLVIIAAEWGHGRRTGWLSNYHLAAKADNRYAIIGKTFKGLTDREFTELTQKLQELKISEERFIRVEPKIIVEVEFDNIQESNRYTSGLALRFARIKRIRYDKTVEDVDTIETVKELYQSQLERQKRAR
ncbi:MAG: ATP-dependent DNA ligase [Candidatus Hodarchaeota archaeon]